MENRNLSKPLLKMKCPQCGNYTKMLSNSKGIMYGNCNICKITFYNKEHSSKEWLIRIIKH